MVAEALLVGPEAEGQQALFTYKFRGGIPKCWVEIDSQGKKETLGSWVPMRQLACIGADPLDQPVAESVEDYFAVIVPKPGAEQTYRLVCALTKVPYPPNPRREFAESRIDREFRATLPDLLPEPPRPEGQPGLGFGGFSGIEDEVPRPVVPGKETELNWDSRGDPKSARVRIIRLKVRFYTPAELAAAWRQPPDAR